MSTYAEFVGGGSEFGSRVYTLMEGWWVLNMTKSQMKIILTAYPKDQACEETKPWGIMVGIRGELKI